MTQLRVQPDSATTYYAAKHNCQPTVREPDHITTNQLMLTYPRLRGAIIGFRLRHREWPQRVFVAPEVFSGHIRAIFDGNYVGSGYSLELRAVLDRVAIAPSKNLEEYVAENDSGSRFDYGNEDGEIYQTDRARGLFAVWVAGPPPVYVAVHQDVRAERIDAPHLLRRYRNLANGSRELWTILEKPLPTDRRTSGLRQLIATGATTYGAVAALTPDTLRAKHSLDTDDITYLAGVLFFAGLNFGLQTVSPEPGLAIVTDAGTDAARYCPELDSW